MDRHTTGGAVAVALSGGADSLALAAAAVAEVVEVRALIVDHALQTGSDAVAHEAAERATALGCADAQVLTVQVDGVGGLEAAARRARYAALDTARDNLPVLLGHTLDDQAETVLLGLARGSGPRSIAGMRSFDSPWGRPFLTVRRETTHDLCRDLGIEPHQDPHNFDDDFTRVRLRRQVLPLLEDVLGGGAAEALARTADLLREDCDVLDVAAESLYGRARVDDDALDTETLITEPAALRRRVIRRWLTDQGVNAVTAKHLHAIDELVSAWRGQGSVAVPGGRVGARLVASRRRGRLTLDIGDS